MIPDSFGSLTDGARLTRLRDSPAANSCCVSRMDTIDNVRKYAANTLSWYYLLTLFSAATTFTVSCQRHLTLMSHWTQLSPCLYFYCSVPGCFRTSFLYFPFRSPAHCISVYLFILFPSTHVQHHRTMSSWLCCLRSCLFELMNVNGIWPCGTRATAMHKSLSSGS